MTPIVKHCAANICLNGLFILLAIVSWGSTYFSLMSLTLGLHSVRTTVQLEDVRGKVYSSYSDFDNFACGVSGAEDITVVCKNIDQFEAAGILYFVLSSAVIVSVGFSIANLVMLLLKKRNLFSKLSIVHYLNAPVYIVTCLCFMIVANAHSVGKANHVQVSYEAGFYLMCLCTAILLLCLGHYIFMQKTLDLQAEEALLPEDLKTLPDIEALQRQKSELEKMLKEKEEELYSKNEKIQSMKNERHKKKPLEASGPPPLDIDLQEPGHIIDRMRELIDSLEDDPRAPELRRRLAELSNDHEKQLGELEQLRNELASLNLNKSEEIERLRSSNKDLEIENLRLAEASKSLYEPAHVTLLKQDLTEAQLQADLKSEECERLHKLVQKHKELSNSKEKEAETTEDKLRNLERAYRQTESELADHKKWLGEKEEELKNLKNQHKDTMTKLRDTAEELEIASDALKRLKQSADNRPSANLEELELLKVDCASLQDKVNKLTDALKAEREEKNNLDLLNEDLKAQNSDLTKQLNDLKDQLKNLLDKEAPESYQSYLYELKEKLSQLDDAQKEKEEIERQLAKTKQILKDNQFLLKNATDEIDNLKEHPQESDVLRAKNAELNEELDQLKRQLGDFRNKIKHQEDDWERERDGIIHRMNQLRADYDQLMSVLKDKENHYENELQQKYDELEKANEALKKLQIQHEVAEHEKDRFGKTIDQLKAKLAQKELASEPEGLQKMLENQIAELTHNLQDTEKKLENILAEKDDLRDELRKKQNELLESSEECQHLHNKLYQLSEERKHSDSEVEMAHSQHSFHNTSLSSSRNPKDLMIIDSLAPTANQNNPLLENVSRLRREPPMSNNNVFKLFEALLLEKCKQDKLELAIGRQPRTMTEYMLDFVYLHYGLKSLALKQLKALIASLENLYRMGHPYGVLFCRFLGLFHPRPLPYHLTIFLVMVQELFTSLSHKLRDKPSSFAEQYELLQFGGRASIIDVMELLAKICRHNRSAGERILTEMTRDRNDRLELVILKVCATMARMGKTPDYIFEILDVDRSGGYVDYQEFVDGIRLTLNIWITQEEAEDLCAYIDDEYTGNISYQDWINKINFVDYADKVYSKMAMVSKSDFLIALVEEYEHEVVQDYYELLQMVRMPYLNESAVTSLLLQIDPTLRDEDVERIYIEAVQQERDPEQGVTPEGFCISVLKNRIGGYGVGMFDVYDLDPSLPKTSTGGVYTELVVERDTSGKLEVDLRKKLSK